MKATITRAQQWALRFGALPLLGSIPALRAASGASDKQIRVPGGIAWMAADADGVRCEWLAPPDAPEDCALLYLHGGGGVLGLYNSSRNMIGHLALVCGVRVLAVDYRLAPEDPFPAGLHDCVGSYYWLLSQGFASRRIGIAGDSMGGLLALTTALMVRDAGRPLPAALACLSPNTDASLRLPTIDTNAWRDALLSPQFARRMMSLVAAGHDLHDPYLSPLDADPRGLPPVLLQAGGEEILLDDSRCFAEKARAAGVDVELQVWPRMWHDWQSCVPGLPEANDAIAHVGKFLEGHGL